MVYRFKNIRTDFGLGNMPEDNIVYSRFDYSIQEFVEFIDKMNLIIFKKNIEKEDVLYQHAKDFVYHFLHLCY